MAFAYRTKKGKRYRATWYDAEGNRCTKGGFATKQLAKAWENKMLTLRQTEQLNPYHRAAQTTLADAVALWWERRIFGKKMLNTQDSYARAVNRWVLGIVAGSNKRAAHAIGHLRMTQVTSVRLNQWMHDMEDAGATDHQRAEAGRVLSAALTFAGGQGLLMGGANPMSMVTERPQLSSRRAKIVVTPEEIELIRLAMLSHRAGRFTPVHALRAATIVSFASDGGFRPEEWLPVRPRHFEFDAGGVWVNDVYTAGELRLGDTKTHDPGRWVDLAPQTLRDVKILIEIRNLGPNDLLFGDDKGELTSNTLKSFRASLRAAVDRVLASRPDLEDRLRPVDADTAARNYVNAKDLRTTAVSLQVRAGGTNVDWHGLAERFGHTVPTMQQFYGQFIKAMKHMPVIPVAEHIAQEREKQGTDRLRDALYLELTGGKPKTGELVNLDMVRAKRA